MVKFVAMVITVDRMTLFKLSVHFLVLLSLFGASAAITAQPDKEDGQQECDRDNCTSSRPGQPGKGSTVVAMFFGLLDLPPTGALFALFCGSIETLAVVII